MSLVIDKYFMFLKIDVKTSQVVVSQMRKFAIFPVYYDSKVNICASLTKMYDVLKLIPGNNCSLVLNQQL